jgi:hypothetical protein
MAGRGEKRAREQGAGDAQTGREQLLFTSPEMQIRVGQKYCDVAQLVPLMLAHGLVRRVRTIAVEVRPLGGDSFKITLTAAAPTVRQAKAEIARVQGTEAARQELWEVTIREDGGAVREDDAEPVSLEDESIALEDGAVVAMAVKELPPLVWRTFPEEFVELSEGGAMATHFLLNDVSMSLVTTGVELTEGRHYWEVELLSRNVDMYVGVCRLGLDTVGYNIDKSSGDSFISTDSGGLYGNGRRGESSAAGTYVQGDRVGILLDLDKGSLLFFKNGVKHGHGYSAGSMKGPLVAAIQIWEASQCVRIHGLIPFPAGHA